MSASSTKLSYTDVINDEAPRTCKITLYLLIILILFTRPRGLR